MKTLNKIIAIYLALMIYHTSSAQPGRGLPKAPPRINGAARAAANASINAARIHANSNSVVGAGNAHPNYVKKEEPKKEETKDAKVDADVKKDKGKKQKK